MLPKLYYQRYQKFSQMLQQISQATAASGLDAQKLRHNFLAAQQFFQQQIVSLDSSELDPADESKVRSYQTEMSKQLNLLGMDVTFLQAARQSETAKTRQEQILQRLQTLTRYCDALMEGARS
jgi:septum formation inhibitor MinC